MVTRRKLILSAAAALLAPVLPRHAAAADDPAGILTAIYTRVAKGKGDGGGTFVIQTKANRTKYLSNALVALWAKADARTRKGESGPVDFDPVTNSQDPDVKSFKVAAEKQAADKATIAVTIESHQPGGRANPADKTICYEFVHDAAAVRVDRAQRDRARSYLLRGSDNVGCGKVRAEVHNGPSFSDREFGERGTTFLWPPAQPKTISAFFLVIGIRDAIGWKLDRLLSYRNWFWSAHERATKSSGRIEKKSLPRPRNSGDGASLRVFV